MKCFVLSLAILVVFFHTQTEADFLGGGSKKENTEEFKADNEKAEGPSKAKMGETAAKGAKNAVVGCDLNKCIVDLSKQAKSYATIVSEVLKSEKGKGSEAFTTAFTNLQKMVELGKKFFPSLSS